MKRVSLALAVILLSLPALAQELPPPLRVVTAVLGLSEDQLHALVETIQARDAAVRPLAEQLQAKHEALQRLVESASADATAVGGLVLEIRAIEQQIATTARSAAESFKQHLTPEQRERLNALRNAAPVCEILPAFKAAGLL